MLFKRGVALIYRLPNKGGGVVTDGEGIRIRGIHVGTP